MRIDIKHRDGAARLGTLQIEKKIVAIPNIIFISTPNIKPHQASEIIETENPVRQSKAVQIQPLGSIWNNVEKNRYADLFIPKSFIYPSSMPDEFHRVYKDFNQNKEWCIVSGNKDGKIVISNMEAGIFTLANSYSLYKRSSVFLNNIIKLREKIGYQKMLHVPAVASPSNIPLLLYIGVDLIDSVYAVISAINGYLLFPEGRYHKNNIDKRLCKCKFSNDIEDPEDITIDMIVEHNQNVLVEELLKAKMSIKNGRLRELVEARAAVSIEVMEKLRLLYYNYYNFLEKRTATVKSSLLKSPSRNSLYYPEIIRFRRRVLERYKKPESARILLLLPCSAKKPYSMSKSHRIFRNILVSSKNPWIIHEVIVTSPLGLVPRELEMIYPAGNYDIPVTGIWDEDEKAIITKMMREYLERNGYDLIISHLPEPLNSIVSSIDPDTLSTCRDHPTSKESLKLLLSTIKKNVEEDEYVKFSTRINETVKAIARYQFGMEIADILLDNASVNGKYPSLRIYHKKNQIGSISKNRGFISLTLEGGKKILPLNKYVITIEKGLKPTGSILAVGVEKADPDIREGDEVLVVRDNDLYAVGIARMNGEEMISCNRGEAVKVRHHI